MSKIYDEYMDDLYPKDLFIEIFTQYYGDKNRKFIEERINTTNVIFVPTNLSSYKIKETYRNLNIDENEMDFDKLVVALKNLQQGVLLGVVAETLVKFKPIIESLGFDLHKIVKKRILTGELVIVDSSETKRFKEFIANEVKNLNVSEDNINIDSFLEYYNKCATDQKLYNFTTKTDNNTFTVNTSEETMPNARNFVLNNFLVIDNLTEQEKVFLFDLFQLKTNLNFLDKRTEKYVVKNLNKIFKTDFKSIKEMLTDNRLTMFFECVNCLKPHINQFIADENVNKEDYADASIENYYSFASKYFMRAPTVAGFYGIDNEQEQGFVALNIGGNISISDSIHEANHVLSLNDFGRSVGFKSVGLKEIVNEFLTKRAIENYNANVFEKDQEIPQSKSGYDVGVNLLNKFLLKFENKFKECQLAGETKSASTILANFIGAENFDKLCEFADFIKENNWGSFNVPMNNSGIKYKDECNIAEWLEIYKENPNIIDLVPKGDLDKVVKFIEMQKFLELLVERYQLFEEGKETSKFEIFEEDYKFNHKNEIENII